MSEKKRFLKFGMDERRALSGAELYVRIFQVTALMPVLYIFIATGHMSIMSTRNVLSILFDIGMSALPRVETLGISWVYRMTRSECIVVFIPLAIAIALGAMGAKWFKGNAELSRRVHKVLAVLIACDLVLRVVPVAASLAFGLPAQIAGFAIRAVCLFLIVMDMRADKK